MNKSNNVAENFVGALEYYISLSGKTKKEIADAIGVPPTTFSSWTKGRHLPDMEKLQALANYLNAPIEHLFEFSLERMPEKEIKELHNKIDTDEEFVKFLKVFLQLSDENKNLLTVIALKLKN